MTAFSRYIAEQENLFPLSAAITGGLLLLIFLLAQLLGYNPLMSEEIEKKMQVRELVKLEFKPQPKPSPRPTPRRRSSPPPAKVARTERPRAQPQKPAVNVAAITQGLEVEALVSNTLAKRRANWRTSNEQPSVTTQVQRRPRQFATTDLPDDFSVRSRTAGGRQIVSGTNGSPEVTVGGGSRRGAVSSVDGDAVTGRASARTSRRVGSGEGGPTVAIPMGTEGEGEAALDLHALIEWMKAHPGHIPRLVQHEMGHRPGDLSSAVTFSLNGRRFRLFLSCNEVEMLLRICLVEDDHFTLLKDNGIREESNFLTMGEVVQSAGRIQSLISSRKAPEERAAAFYDIFWSWWQQQE